MGIDTTVIPQTTKVDGVTIENNSGIINVKSGGIGLNELQNNVITLAKINKTTGISRSVGGAYYDSTPNVLELYVTDTVKPNEFVELNGLIYVNGSTTGRTFVLQFNGTTNSDVILPSFQIPTEYVFQIFISPVYNSKRAIMSTFIRTTDGLVTQTKAFTTFTTNITRIGIAINGSYTFTNSYILGKVTPI